MTQNIISLHFTDADLTAIDEALALVEQKLTALVGLSPEVRRGLVNRDYMDVMLWGGTG